MRTTRGIQAFAVAVASLVYLRTGLPAISGVPAGPELPVASGPPTILGFPPLKLARVPAARSGSIRGRVDLRRPATPAERRPSIAELGTPPPRDVPNLLRSVVYLEAAPRGAFEATEGGHAILDQRNETFVPHVLAIMTGTTVEFPNSDKFYHNVFSLSKTRRFDLGRYSAGHSKAVRFDRPGIVRVFCDIHSHMNAFILVFSHPFFVLTDTHGRYRIDNIPAGTYHVIAWNEGTTSDPKPAAVPDGGIAELDFTVP